MNAEADSTLVAAIRRDLRDAADPTLARAMQAYMKSAMPYLGVRVPVMRSLTRAAERARPPSDLETLIATAGTLWREATHREDRYAATALLDTTAARRLRDLRLVPLIEEMIRTGAWWDHVDEVSHRVGDLHRLDPYAMDVFLRQWSHDDDLWTRRSAIISQLGHKTETDLELLGYVLEANIDDRRFFIAKAIGWALREYARTDADWVRAYVGARADRMAPLSRREALKHLV